MRDGELAPDWLKPVDAALAERGGVGLFVVLFPAYRPDLVKALAHHLDLDFFDFRAQVMAKLGADAGTLDLDALERSIVGRTQQRGVALMNAEALMAVKPAPERKRWLRKVLGLALPCPAVIPLAIFADDAPIDDSRVVDLAAEVLPDQSLIGRLAN